METKVRSGHRNANDSLAPQVPTADNLMIRGDPEVADTSLVLLSTVCYLKGDNGFP
jgi:hypothetical protein